jgi:hypothetical protein
VTLRIDADALVVALELAAADPDRLAAARQRIDALGGVMEVAPADERVYVSAAIPSPRPSLR